MIFGTPVSWFINEVIASALLIIVIVHILNNEKPLQRLLELFCFILTAGIFENIGVWAGMYDYSLHRILMFGKVPLSILFIEGVILYATMNLAERVDLPKWATPFMAGVLSSVQDMTLDPASVYDLHTFGTSTEGMWNWTQSYTGGFVSIPYYNFSGWLTMMLYFTACIQIGRHLVEKTGKKWLSYAYPFISIVVTVLLLVSPINQILLYLLMLGNKTTELAMLCINYAVCLFIMLHFARYTNRFDRKRDWIVFFLPIFLHAYALVSCIVLGISQAVLPVVIVIVLHGAYLAYAYRRMSKAEPAEAPSIEASAA